jgi:hypothetical protein
MFDVNRLDLVHFRSDMAGFDCFTQQLFPKVRVSEVNEGVPSPPERRGLGWDWNYGWALVAGKNWPFPRKWKLV